MPEIAEVETVKNTLKNMVLNKKIQSVNVIYDKMVESNIDDFQKILLGKKIIDIKRIGKWLIFDLEDYYLLSHLRMEGKFFVKNTNEQINKHEHIIISFTDKTDLRYHDTRKFGRMNLIKKEDLDNDIDKNHITINAKKEEENKEDTKGYRKSEFRYGEFSRTVYFPLEIDVEKTSAKLEHGILRIEAPKLAAEKEGIKKLTVN